MNVWDSLNIVAQCRRYRVSLWSCPQFIFLIMGVVMILSIFMTYTIAQRHTEPQVALLIVLGLTAFLFIVAHIVVGSFDRVVQVARSKAEFVNIASHQLRGPLSIMKWQFNLLHDAKIKISPGKFSSYTKQLEKEVERMIRLVNSLLEVNHIEDGSFILNPETFSITELIDKAIKDHGSELDALDINIVFSKDGVDEKVFADPRKVRSIMSNLLDNAIFYGSHQGGTIRIEAKQDDSMVRISINDEGIGIDKLDQEKIFDKFFRASRSYELKTDGSGISLYIARAYIKASGGKIGFFSKPQKGSTFWFTLPVATENRKGSS